MNVREQDIFEVVGTLRRQLDEIYGGLRSSQRGKLQPPLLLELAADVQRLFNAHKDVCLGAIHLTQEPSYLTNHSIYTAFLTEQTATTSGMSLGERTPLVAAALTHDIGMHRLQESLNKQKDELSPLQQQKIRQHTVQGWQMLADVGVKDEGWLDAVLHHHERLDGTGYPHGLMDAAITPSARLMAVCDVYSAMLTPHAYRDGITAVTALRELLVKNTRQLDSRLVQALVKGIGIYPPGTLVKLVSGEVGVVRERGEGAATPRVLVMFTPKGQPIVPPELRDTSDSAFKVEIAIDPNKLRVAAAAAYKAWRDILFAPPEMSVPPAPPPEVVDEPIAAAIP